MSNKPGTSSQVLTLPQGGGALASLGETFSPDLFTGTGNLSVPLALPSGRNGLQPQLQLAYSSGNGNGPFGLGWALSVPGISRKTSDGVPRYRDGAADPAERDTFLLSGMDDLVAVSEPEPGAVRYRPRTETLFARIDRVRSQGQDRWRVSAKDGLVSFYGARPDGDEAAVVADPADPSKVFTWLLSLTTDPLGNRIEYDYLRDRGSEGPRTWDQSYLQEVRYVDFEEAGRTRFLVSVRLVYEPRPDPFSDHRAGFEIRTRLRCRRIEVRTHADGDPLTRTYELAYLDDLVAAGEVDAAALPANGVSLLSRVTVVGHDGNRTQALPPLDLAYTRFTTDQRRFQDLEARNDALPPRSLAHDDLEMVDLFGNGLPDIVQLNGTAQFWRNLGDGRFDAPQAMPEIPAGVELSDPGVQLADTNGNGRADLLVLARSGYFPLGFEGRWSSQGFVRYPSAPSVDPGDGETRLVDLDGDGVVDALRTGTRFELFLNDPRRGWEQVETRPRGPLDEFPDVSFSDHRVKLADLSGDGLQDIVLVQQGRIDYWPYLGHGRWGRRITMSDNPVFRDAPPVPGGFDPRRVLFGDLDGDGLDDVIYVEAGRLTFWINRGGEGWSEPVTIRSTPPFGDIDAVRLADMLGTGMAGVLWTFDRTSGTGSNYRFLDLTGGRKPYLLDQVDNNMGAVTRVRYAPSTDHYLADVGRPETRWRTPLPFPVQVVDRVEVVDQVSGGKLASELRYHHGYWDGSERELRGFGMVERSDTQSFEQFNQAGLHGGDVGIAAVDEAHFAPPCVTRTWFHLGPIGEEAGPRREADLSAGFWAGDPSLFGRAPGLEQLLRSLPVAARADALRSLRGRVLRTELFVDDGHERADRPFTVTETQHDVREESPPPADGGGSRRRIFFPHTVAERTTRWERGDDPMTRFVFSADHDELGHCRVETEIACPRGWRRLADRPDQAYVARRTRRVMARPLDADSTIRDRVARTTRFDIRGTSGLRVLDLAGLPDDQLTLEPVAHSVSYYDGAPFVGLPAGQVGRFGALTRRADLVLTEELVRRAQRESGDDAGGLPPYLQPDGAPDWTDEYPTELRESLPDLAGYRFEPGDAFHLRGYYAQGERVRYDFHASRNGRGRGLPLTRRDPAGSDVGERDTTVRYDRFGLLPIEVTDPVGLVIQARHDYRVLQARLAVDANGNRQLFAYTPLGLLERVVHQGKQGEAVGDTLQRPGTSYRYDFAHTPVSVHTSRRVQHVNGSADTPGQDDVIESTAYSDGFGRVVQTRSRAERTYFGDEVFGRDVVPTEPSADDADELSGRAVPARETNVVVSGARLYDNKGRIVERYEPFFARGLGYRPPGDAEQGQRVTIAYDPVGRVVLTTEPDGSQQRMVPGIPLDITRPDVFEPTPWESYLYDPNDNAGRTHTDDASRYRHHWDTPTSAVVDASGRTVAVVERRRSAAGDGTNGPVEELVTRYDYDGRDRLSRVVDPLGRTAFAYEYDLADRLLRRQAIDAGLHRAVFDVAGNEVERRSGRGCLTLQAHDVLNRRTRLWARDEADDAVSLRELLVYGDGGDSDQPAEARSEARQANRLGALHEHYDEAGLARRERYDFKGNPVELARQVVSDDVLLSGLAGGGTRLRIDWDPPVGTDLGGHAQALLDPVVYETSTTYDALNRAVVTVCPRGVDGRRRQVRAAFDQAGGLEQVAIDDETFVDRIAYDAKGQRTLVALGNGVMTRYAYDPRTAALVRARAERYTKPTPDATRYQPRGAPLQDIQYRYDAVGNILEQIERVPGCGVRANPEAATIGDPALRALVAAGDALVRRFTYDSTYRVTSASGRESAQGPSPEPWADARRAGPAGRPAVPTPRNAADLTRVYRESYSYDAAGNLTQLQHMALGANGTGGSQFRRTFELHTGSNRLRKLTAGGTAIAYTSDLDGNIVGEASSRRLDRDHANRLAAFRVQNGESPPSLRAVYLYDAGGRRVKKLVHDAGGNVESVTYIGGVFERHRWRRPDGSGTGAGENDQLHVLDGEQRVATLRIGPPQPDDTSPASQYHLGDHLRSASITLDADGELVDREEYTPYGETSFGSFGRKRYRFCGHERDAESGLYHIGARHYAPGLGRWSSADPAGLAGGMNAFTYTESNPVNLTDSTGLQPDTDTMLVTTSSGATYGGTMADGFERVDYEAQVLGVADWWTSGSFDWDIVYAGSDEVIEIQGRTETIWGNIFSSEDGQYAMLLRGESTTRIVTKEAWDNARYWSSYLESLTPEQLEQAFGGVEALGRFLDDVATVVSVVTPHGRAAATAVDLIDGTAAMIRAESNSERGWAAAEMLANTGVPGVRGIRAGGRATGAGLGSGNHSVHSLAARPGGGGRGGRRGGGGGGHDPSKPRDPSGENPWGGGPHREVPPDWGKPPGGGSGGPPRAPEDVAKKISKAIDKLVDEKTWPDWWSRPLIQGPIGKKTR